MKTKTLKSTLAFICSAILFTGSAAMAQSETSLALPKADKANFTVEVGPLYTYADAKDGHLNLYGLSAAFGWRIDKHHKVGVELGFLYGTDDADGVYTFSGDTQWNEGDIDYTAIPMMLNYSFYIPLDKNGKWEARITPTVGFMYLNMDWEVKRNSYKITDDDDKFVFMYGGAATITYHINTNFYIQGGYRYMKTNKADLHPFKGAGFTSSNFGKMNLHSVAASFGWKF